MLIIHDDIFINFSENVIFSKKKKKRNLLILRAYEATSPPKKIQSGSQSRESVSSPSQSDFQFFSNILMPFKRYIPGVD